MKGIVPSLNTPFDANGGLDLLSVRRLVNHTVDAGCGGMLALAVAGEHATLTLAEKTAFIEAASESNAGRIPFIVSVTAPDSAASLVLAKIAAFYDAAGICVQLPEAFDRDEKLSFLHDLARQGPGVLMVQDLDWEGGGLPLEEITFLFERVDKFSWLKIETTQAGPKYTAVLRATDGALHVCGGWAVAQLMDAMARGVHAFIPTGMERVYVAIYRAYETGDTASAVALFERVLPVLEFSNQHIDTSIRLFKELRKAEGLFETSICRAVAGSLEAVDGAEGAQALETALKLMRDMETRGSG